MLRLGFMICFWMELVKDMGSLCGKIVVFCLFSNFWVFKLNFFVVFTKKETKLKGKMLQIAILLQKKEVELRRKNLIFVGSD